jgi:diguanylate cyclase (GGDEF)-like protein
MASPANVTSIDRPVFSMSHGDEATLPSLNVLNALKRPLAVMAPDGRVLFHNRAFAELFSRPECGAALLARLDGTATPAASFQVNAEDGRVFSLEMTEHPEGLLVFGEDISGRNAGSAWDSAGQIDPVTQLADRQTFRERIAALLAHPEAEIAPAAVLLVNLDRFRAVNDALGHAVGDKLLQLVADRIRSAIGSHGFSARLGNDEFALVYGGPQPQSASSLAERLIDLLGRSYIVDGNLLNIGVSIGIAVIPDHGANHDQILKNANLALNHAKRAGRGTFRFFAGAMDEEMRALRSLEIDLRRALALRELSLAYQPQYNIASGRITGFEALLRWRHPVRGHVSPAEFIPMAEEIGLIVPIGEWVIRTACEDAMHWPDPLSVAVNVSAVQFRGAGLAQTILSALGSSGLRPERLELEITESALLTDHDAVLDLLHKMRGMGVSVAMDDFGTGYSSLSYLRSFPFDKIKIDQCFVRGSPDDPAGRAIVRAIAALGQSLGMATMAEGVETADQLARIAADGCTGAQGYLICRPMPADKIDAFLKQPLDFAKADQTA